MSTGRACIRLLFFGTVLLAVPNSAFTSRDLSDEIGGTAELSALETEQKNLGTKLNNIMKLISREESVDNLNTEEIGDAAELSALETEQKDLGTKLNNIVKLISREESVDNLNTEEIDSAAELSALETEQKNLGTKLNNIVKLISKEESVDNLNTEDVSSRALKTRGYDPMRLRSMTSQELIRKAGAVSIPWNRKSATPPASNSNSGSSGESGGSLSDGSGLQRRIFIGIPTGSSSDDDSSQNEEEGGHGWKSNLSTMFAQWRKPKGDSLSGVMDGSSSDENSLRGGLNRELGGGGGGLANNNSVKSDRDGEEGSVLGILGLGRSFNWHRGRFGSSGSSDNRNSLKDGSGGSSGSGSSLKDGSGGSSGGGNSLKDGSSGSSSDRKSLKDGSPAGSLSDGTSLKAGSSGGEPRGGLNETNKATREGRILNDRPRAGESGGSLSDKNMKNGFGGESDGSSELGPNSGGSSGDPAPTADSSKSKTGGSGSVSSANGKYIKLESNGVQITVISPNRPQHIVIKKNSVQVNKRLACYSIERLKPESTYQKARDGSLWYTNLSMGDYMTKEEIEQFKEEEKKMEEAEKIEREKEKEREKEAEIEAARDEASNVTGRDVMTREVPKPNSWNLFPFFGTKTAPKTAENPGKAVKNEQKKNELKNEQKKNKQKNDQEKGALSQASSFFGGWRWF